MRFLVVLLAGCELPERQEATLDASPVTLTVATVTPSTSTPELEPGMVRGEVRYAEEDCPRPGLEPGELLPPGAIVQARRCVVGDPTVCYPADDRLSLSETSEGIEAFIFTCSQGAGDVEYVITWIAPSSPL